MRGMPQLHAIIIVVSLEGLIEKEDAFSKPTDPFFSCSTSNFNVTRKRTAHVYIPIHSGMPPNAYQYARKTIAS